MKVAELDGPALDWAVAKCEDFDSWYYNEFDHCVYMWPDEAEVTEFAPSTNWAQGGPIIERCQLTVEHDYNEEWVAQYSHPYQAGAFKAFFSQSGPSPLIAAMRCYVASKLGADIDVPPELI